MFLDMIYLPEVIAFRQIIDFFRRTANVLPEVPYQTPALCSALRLLSAE